MKKGVPVSPGVAVARAFCVDEVLARREAAQLDVTAVSGEIQRFEDAVGSAALELDAIVERVSSQLGEEEAAIFRAHRLLLRDPALVGKVKSIIRNRQVDAGTALHDTLDEYTELFARIPDEYLQERMADKLRVSTHLFIAVCRPGERRCDCSAQRWNFRIYAS